MDSLTIRMYILYHVMSNTPSPRDRRREREQALRRADVLAAAAEVFAEKGFHDTQIAEIAKAAELSLASIYSLFEGKDEIYQAVVYAAADSIRKAVEDKVGSIPDPAERLIALIDSLFTCFEENQYLLQIYARGTQGLPWRTRQIMGDRPMEMFHAFTSWVASLAAEAKKSGYLRDIGAESFAISLIGAVTATAAHWIEHYPKRPLSRAAPPVKALFAQVLERRQ